MISQHSSVLRDDRIRRRGQHSRSQTGQSVAVFGCGGIGLNAVQGASITGAYPIIGIDILDSKLELARHFGATHTINLTTDDLTVSVKH